MKYERMMPGSKELLGVLATAPLTEVLPRSEIVTHPEGNLVCEPDQLPAWVFLVLRGSCAWRSIGSPATLHSAEHYSRGDIFGGNGTGEHLASKAELLATTDCVLLKVPCSELAKLAQPAENENPRGSRPTLDESKPGIEFTAPAQPAGRLITLANLRSGPDEMRVPVVLAERLQQETGASVALVELIRTDPARRSRGGLDGSLNGHPISFPHRSPRHDACQFLRVGFAPESPSTEALRPLLNDLRSRFTYVLVALSVATTPFELLFACVRQSETAYLLVGVEQQSIDDLDVMLRELKPRLNSHTPVSLRPVLCLAEGESPRGTEAKLEAVNAPLHACLRQRPASANRSSAAGNGMSAGLSDRDVRRLAREIGGCLVGLALSSGGVKGMAHVGVIQVLEENGLDVDIVAGTSMGAYVGSLWAYGCNADKLLELAMEMSTRGAIWRVLDPVFPPRQGFLRGLAVKRRLERTMGDVHFSELARPLRVVATDLDTLDRAVFSNGEVSTAVHASAAVPGIFVPVAVGDRAFMDGGIVDPLPTDVLWEMGVRRILAVSTIPTPGDIRRRLNAERRLAPHARPRARKVGRAFPPIGDHLNYFAQGNILDIFMHSIQGGQIRVAEPAFRQASLVLRPRLADTRWLDFSITPRCVAAGRAVAERHLEEIKALLKGVRYEYQATEPTLAATA